MYETQVNVYLYKYAKSFEMFLMKTLYDVKVHIKFCAALEKSYHKIADLWRK